MDELALLAERLEGSLDPHVVLPTVATAVVQSLPARYAAVYLKRPDAEELILAAESGSLDGGVKSPEAQGDVDTTSEVRARAEPPPRTSLTFPLLYRSEVVGQLIVVPHEGRQPTPDESRLLALIAWGAGSAAQLVRQEHDLLQARERLVLAREEERRLLRRNLHDTIGPTLAALSLKAGLLRNLIEEDLPTAQEQLNELRDLIHVVITDIRRVVYNLRPPALDELGMLPAIQEQVRQSSTGGLQVSLVAPDQMPPLSAAVEVAVYRIVMEALTNVERHAQARHCRISIIVDDQVTIEVVDDGVGLRPNHRAGVGLSSMRERVAELGGSCKVESSPGGVRVLAVLPALPPGWEKTSTETALRMEDSG